MSVLNENQLLGASGAGGDYEIEQSLRFDKGSTPYLNRTFAAVGNRKTWTFSAWIKRAGLTDGTKTIFSSYAANNDAGYFDISFLAADTIGVHTWGTTFRVSNQLFRDTSAWYHVVLAVDTTQGTASNRLKVYVNGDEITSWSTNNAPSQNFDTAINNDKIHSVGALSSTAAFVDGYMGEVNFIDGQALTPDSFGETGKYGEWNPIEYAGTYGTNGFYLPFKQDYTVEGFSTVTYEGKGVAQYIGGTGFSPSLVWTKARNQTYDHHLFDVIRGPLKRISSNSTSAESSMTNSLTAFNTDGFTLGDTAQVNLNGGEFVAWNWDMGGTTASNTAGSITSSVRANTAYGQSIVADEGSGNVHSIGHGLASAPDMIIRKNRDSSRNWAVWHKDLTANYALEGLNTTGAQVSGGSPSKYFRDVNSTTFSVGDDVSVNENGDSYISYCFHDVTGYSKFGSYTANNSSTGPSITTGFSPAFVIIKDIEAANNWIMYDNTRDPSNPNTAALFPDSSQAEAEYGAIDFNATGFQIKSTVNALNNGSREYIYAAFADTREYAYWYDQSGNNNDWTSEGGLTESDVMVDSPTNNFCTLNPLDIQSQIALSEGNLKVRTTATGGGYKVRGTQQLTGKVYFEGMVGAVAGNIGSWFGIADNGGNITSFNSNRRNGFYYNASNMRKMVDGAVTVIGSGAATAGDVIGLSFDLDNNVFTIKKNNVALLTNQAFTDDVDFSTIVDIYRADSTDTGFILNFGQDSSFAGNKTPQGNSDSNGIGDFYYAPSTGFLALCTANLPSVDVIPSENFNTVLYTGNDSTNVITGVGFKSDFSWWKKRNAATDHALIDSVRGVTKHLVSNTTNAEITANVGTELVSFDSDGFTLGAAAQTNSINGTSASIVAWNWKAGGTAVSNTNGSITSSVSANVDAGFSIVSYTGTGSAATVGHGLTLKAPEMIICKNRDAAPKDWRSYHTSLGNAQAINLNDTAAAFSSTTSWNSTTPTSTVFSIGTASTVNGSSNSMIAYAFHSVDGYSKVGSYTGNGDADGTFVNLGFRPAFVILKRSDSASSGHWVMKDSKRDESNGNTIYVMANNSNADTDNAVEIDFLSNGFKQRSTNNVNNANASTYIYLAFAENPFKHTNAR